MIASISNRLLAVALCAAGCGVAAQEIPPEVLPQRSSSYNIRGMPVESIEFMDFFRGADAAIEAAASIDDEIFLVRARPAAVDGGWVVTARYRELPEPGVLELHEEQMAALGRRLGGHGLMPGFRGPRFRPEMGTAR